MNTLDADPPANKIARQRRKLPAGNFVPDRNGWLCHVSFGFGQFGFGCQPDERELVGYLLCRYDRNKIIGATW